VRRSVMVAPVAAWKARNGRATKELVVLS
jgi:hypothetical protein